MARGDYIAEDQELAISKISQDIYDGKLKLEFISEDTSSITIIINKVAITK